jgi:hypothetical protein
MAGQTALSSLVKSVKELWHALLLIVPITYGWIWFLIKNINQPQAKKSEMFWDMSGFCRPGFWPNRPVVPLPV